MRQEVTASDGTGLVHPNQLEERRPVHEDTAYRKGLGDNCYG